MSAKLPVIIFELETNFFRVDDMERNMLFSKESYSALFLPVVETAEWIQTFVKHSGSVWKCGEVSEVLWNWVCVQYACQWWYLFNCCWAWWVGCGCVQQCITLPWRTVGAQAHVYELFSFQCRFSQNDNVIGGNLIFMFNRKWNVLDAKHSLCSALTFECFQRSEMIEIITILWVTLWGNLERFQKMPPWWDFKQK